MGLWNNPGQLADHWLNQLQDDIWEQAKDEDRCDEYETGMSMRLFSLMDVSFLAFLPYMTLMRRKMYAVCSTLVRTPMTASQVKFDADCCGEHEVFCHEATEGGDSGKA